MGSDMLRSDFLLESGGIVLAILSFSGLSVRIERGLQNLRRWIAAYAPVLRNGLSDFLPTPANIRRYGLSALWTMSVWVVLFIIGMQSEAESRANLYAIYAVVLPWTWWKVVAVIVGFLPGLYMMWAVIGFLGGVSVYLVLSVLWAIFWVLSRPPSGITGSIGLLIALSGPMMRILGKS